MSEKIIKNIQNVLTDDLLKPEWVKIKNKEKNHKTFGHCYAATEALYYLLGGKESGYFPKIGKSKNGIHWWLENKKGEILDVTSEQFYFKKEIPPYKNSKRNGFLTNYPSKRAKIIINRVNNSERERYNLL